MLKLRELREKKGLSQTELAAKLGFAQNTLSNWESGKRDPDSDTIVMLAEFFDVSTDYLLGKEKSSAKAEDDITFDDFTYAMHNESKQLTEKDKEMLLDMARMMRARQEKGKK